MDMSTVKLILSLLDDATQKINENSINSGSSNLEKMSFHSNIIQKFELIYRYLQEIPESDIKESIINALDKVVENFQNYCEDYNPDLLIPTLDSISFLREYLSNIKTLPDFNEDKKAEYQSKLKIYKQGLVSYSKTVQLYNEGKIPYELCVEEYLINLKNYNELVEEYEKLNDSTLEKPKKIKDLHKKTKDLKIKTLLERTEEYKKLLDVYEFDYFEEYVKSAKKYDDNQLSYEEYVVESLKCADLYFAVKETHEDLISEFEEAEKSFTNSEDYITATQEEITEYYENIRIYEENIKNYQQFVLKLGGSIVE